MRRFAWLVAALLLVGWWTWQQQAIDRPVPDRPVASTTGGSPRIPAADAGLPSEALQTLQRIQRGGPFPHAQDGSVFQNRERLLPAQPRGHYREYTVETPGSRDRGARRIVAGGDPPHEYFYTDDHYRSFRRLQLDGPGR